jgi:hypothetical protein
MAPAKPTPGVILGGMGRGLGSPLLVVFDAGVCIAMPRVVVPVVSTAASEVLERFEALSVVAAEPSELAPLEAVGLGVVPVDCPWFVGSGVVVRVVEMPVSCRGWRT